MSAKNILIVAITRMGDLLQASPTIVGLKTENPNSKITILVDKQFAKICEGIPGIDEIIQIDMNYLAQGIWNGGESLVDTYGYVTDLIDRLLPVKFDLCLNMSNSNYTAILLKLINAPENTGWIADHKGYRLMADKWAMLFTACIYHSNRNFNNINLVDFFRSAAKVTKHPHTLVYNIEQSAAEKVDKLIENGFGDIQGPIISIQVGASQEKRQWAPKKFALLTRYLVEDLNARIIFTGAPAEANIVEETLSHFNSPNIISCVGKTSIPELAAVLKKSEILITGDTGPMHLSVAVGTPVIALFLASALCFETGPYSKGNIVIQPQISCSPCNPNYPCARPDCHDQITPELVTYLSKMRISKDHSHDPFLSVPQDVAPPSQVRVFVSDFDDEGFLIFHPINDDNSSIINLIKSRDLARTAYRRLWKEELTATKTSLDSNFNDSDLENIPSSIGFKYAAIRAIDEANRAVKELKLLLIIAKDPSRPASELGGVSANLSEIDRNLEELSLTFPILGTIVRIFIIDKENLRGEDIIFLTDQTIKLYEDLLRRIYNFTRYFAEFQNDFLDKGELEHDSNQSR